MGSFRCGCSDGGRAHACAHNHQLVEQLNFKGVELLLIDAEGYDTRILRSVAEYCETQEFNGSWEWPEVICCETLGHCNKTDGEGSEDACLQGEGESVAG